ncbi:hypothetical protein [Pantoea allii]|uniref:hypothetical protein n=1 Tax=Pantoea allii TaxID=574096 RepID=UPI000A22BA7F|nr:hypothetical protein [Pantoea allii]MBW1252273.1 hypothetical protein [Pantoea allii]MBW1261552.1 hypothetical protein [Pantoea allii]MBW1283788.1 hypothetical protein [Pantoea allii]ORM86695.1 hypothetical protein HA38_08005 [Pantoea allii]
MQHPFELDPQIIYSQAGSAANALIKFIINSVDADASSIILDITPEDFTCRDDGRGSASREDVKRYF